MTPSHLSLIALKHFYIYSEGLGKFLLLSALWNGLWDISFAQLSITTYNTASCNSRYLSFLCFIEHIICGFERKSVIVVILPMNILLKPNLFPVLCWNTFQKTNMFLFQWWIYKYYKHFKDTLYSSKTQPLFYQQCTWLRQEDSLLSYDQQQVIATMRCPLCLSSQRLKDSINFKRHLNFKDFKV